MKGRWKWVGAILTSVLMTLGYVRLRFLLVEFSYDVATLRQQKTNLEQQNKSLQLTLATLQNPARIEKIARSELHLNSSEGDSKRIDLRGDKK